MGRGAIAHTFASPDNSTTSVSDKRNIPFDDFVEGNGRSVNVLIQYVDAILLHPHTLIYEIAVHWRLEKF
jgi:hypothetical protein